VNKAARPAVHKLLVHAIRAGVAPGFVAGWQSNKNEEPVILALGKARIGKSPSEMTRKTVFDLASLTKPLAIGTLSLLALRDGDLGLDSTVGHVITELRGSDLGRRTVFQLLTHTAGIPAWAPLYAMADGERARIFDALRNLPMEKPDQRVQYSCPGFIVLGLMLERALHEPLDVLVSQRIVGPARLDHQVGYRPAAPNRLAGGAMSPAAERELLAEHGMDPRFIPPLGPGQPDDGNSRFLGGVAGNAGLFGTAEGVLRLVHDSYGQGGLLEPEDIVLAITDHTPGLGEARGLAWQLASTPGCSAGRGLASSSFGHTGFTGTSVWRDPIRSLTLVLFANRLHPAYRGNDINPLRREFHHLVTTSVE
jgi:CubicO group peptidase (beta-lactamase class C family)